MNNQKLTKFPVWKKLTHHADMMHQPEMHLKNLLKDNKRLNNFSNKGSNIFFDYSRHRVNKMTMDLLFELAENRKAIELFNAMTKGEKVNNTENRAALHTATRSFSSDSIIVDDINIMLETREVRNKIKTFATKVHSGEITGSTGKRFKHIVVIGIGGSYLGSEFVAHSLKANADRNIKIHFLANVDIHNFGAIITEIEPETTLWVVISKTYTTAETMANVKQATVFMEGKGLDPSKHFVTVTSKNSPGDDPASPVLETFHMFDYIGGRYSVTSAVGGVPLSLYIGYENFEEFLKGAEEMDLHANNSPPEQNLPLIAALISIWNNNFLGYQAQGIIPYATPLSKLAPHVQQLYMESNGKSVTKTGEELDVSSGLIIFGEPGTNAQHSFFQLAHQGRSFPIDFIGVVNPQYKEYKSKSKGVTNHQELWANLISQPSALAIGKDDPKKAKYFSGNRPSSTILIEDLSPANIGRLLSFYEARTVFEAFIWGINPFDQFGVELGKVLATDIRNEISEKNNKNNHNFDKNDPITKFYLDTLFSGKL
ncbi:MAG: glucose-6-phosphate isomerase [Desulfobacterales bacterium]|nr:glucose-6-phosphate isomerase [Desulfobacteraceae bacterium]MBT7084735.1 glucose-6-phosphate isomerase [Desulfobacterales bacterium]MBT7696018.1 glucose-6-phosphate isomerase [Desulfobacterales bacterium]